MVVTSVASVSSVVNAFAVAAIIACQPATETQGPVAQLPRDGATYWPTAEWRRAEPEQVGLDGPRLRALVERMRTNAISGLHSLIIVRHGYLTVEEYFNGSAASQVHTMQSVSKSVTSLVTGIAIGEGNLSTSTRIFDLLPQYDSLIRGDDRKRAITIGHLLEMRSGINFYEQPYPGSPLERLNTSRGDWAAIALGEPMNAAPGTLWQYNSGGVIALARAVQQATAPTDTLITASGNLNQWLFILPRRDLVVVVTGGANEANVLDFVMREVLPSVLRD